MTVKQLIEELQKMPPDLEVLTEGCDCIGDIGSVEVYQGVKNTLTGELSTPEVILYRSKEK